MRQLFAAALILIAGLASAGPVLGVEISIDDVELAEPDSGSLSLSFTVTLDRPSALGRVNVNYATADSTAIAGEDYEATSGLLTFGSTETMKSVEVTIYSDTLLEGDEIFTVNLSNPVNATIADGVGEGTIIDYESLPTVSIAAASEYEGDTEPPNILSFPVTLSATSGHDVTVYFTEIAGTASPDIDYHPVIQQVVITAGDTAGFIHVELYGDGYYEGDETFSIKISSAINATFVVDDWITGTILDDDPYPTVAVGDASELEGNTFPGILSFPVTLSHAYGEDGRINYSLYPGTATELDYTDLVADVIILSGDTTGAIEVELHGESYYEHDETFTIVVASVGYGTGTIPAGATATGTILNDDPMPTLAIDDVSVPEGGGTATFTVSISGSTLLDASVDYGTVAGTAQSGSDYTSASGALIFTWPYDNLTIDVPILDDGTREPDETFSVVLSNPSDATITDGVGEGTIMDDEPLPTISINDVSEFEGDDDPNKEFIFTISLSLEPYRQVDVFFWTNDNTAIESLDYSYEGGQLTFLPGETEQQVEVTVWGDGRYEGDETFTVDLSGPVNATIADGSGLGTILDDDPYPIVDIANAGVLEGDSGGPDNEIRFPVSLSWPYGDSVTIVCSLYEGTATAAIDYFELCSPQPLVVPSGETLGFITVEVYGDGIVEDDETISMVLQDAEFGILGDSVATGLIVNDDFDTCAPLPGGVSDLRLAKLSGGAELLLTWAEAPDGGDYIVHRDFAPSGAFDDVAGVAPNGASGLTLPMPVFDRYFLVGARNSCGLGPFD